MSGFVSRPNTMRLLLLVVFLTAFAALPLPSDAQPEDPYTGGPIIPDGTWMGFFYSVGAVGSGGATGSGNLDGSMDFESRAGGLSGEFDMSVEGLLGGAGGGTGAGPGDMSTEFSYNSEGIVHGSADAPQLSIDRVMIIGTAVIDGETVPLEFEGAIFAIDSVDVELIHTSCEVVNGRWEVLDAAGGYQGRGDLIATRVDDLRGPIETTRELWADLAAEADDFIATVEATHVADFGVLNDLLTRAENLTHSIARNPGCAGEDGDGDWLLPLAGIVDRLVALALDNPFAFSNADLSRLCRAAVRSGALTPQGAMSDAEYFASHPGSVEMVVGLDQLILERMDQAISAGDVAEITNLVAAAATIGLELHVSKGLGAISVIEAAGG